MGLILILSVFCVGRTKRGQRSVEAEQFVQDSLAQEERDLKEKGEVKHVSTFRQALPQVRTVFLT